MVKLLLIIMINIAVASTTIEETKQGEEVVGKVRTPDLLADHLIESTRAFEELVYNPRNCKEVGHWMRCKTHCNCCGPTTTCDPKNKTCVEAKNRALQCYLKVEQCGMEDRPFCPGEKKPWGWKVYGPI